MTNIRTVLGNQNPIDANLLCFLRAMRYLWYFFPAIVYENEYIAPCVPFCVKVVRDSTEFRAECRSSQAWDGVFDWHTAYRNIDHDKPVVVITGTTKFYEALATRVRPLGHLAD